MDVKENEIYVRVIHGSDLSSSRIHEPTISLRFLGIALRVLSLVEASVYNVYNPLEITVNSKEEDFCPTYVQEFGLCI